MPRLIGAAQTSVFQEALSNNYTSNSTFTAPATGKYISTFAVRVDGITTNDGDLHFVLDASNRDYYYSYSSVGADMDNTSSYMNGKFNHSGVIDMDANDTAKIIVYMSNGRTMNTDNTRTFWQMQLLG